MNGLFYLKFRYQNYVQHTLILYNFLKQTNEYLRHDFSPYIQFKQAYTQHNIISPFLTTSKKLRKGFKMNHQNQVKIQINTFNFQNLI